MSPARKSGHKETDLILKGLKPPHIKEGSWTKSIHLQEQAVA